MEGLERNPLRLSRAGIVMLTWGAIILVTGLYNQYNFPSVASVLLVWGGATMVGVAVQAVCQLRDQPGNFFVWIAATLAGWALTLYIAYGNRALFPYLPALWMVALGLAYVPTARTIESRFWYFAGLHLAIGAVMILAAAGIVKIEALDRNGSLIFALVGGASLISTAFMARVPRSETDQSGPEPLALHPNSE